MTERPGGAVAEEPDHDAGAPEHSAPDGIPASSRAPWDYVLAYSLLALVGLGVWGVALDRINPDAIAYMQLAGYWRRGQWDLALSSYWGPLLIWLIALLQVVFRDPLVAGRLATFLGGGLFIAGSLRFFRALDLPFGVRVLSAVPIALHAAAFSLWFISPDLAVAGLMLLGLAELVRVDPEPNARRLVRAGAWFGVAYYAKAVALPTGVLLIGVTALLGMGRVGLRRRVRAGAVAVGAMLLVALPWLVTVSVHAGGPTLSTSGAAAHAIIGPDAAKRDHPVSLRHKAPPPGRVTEMEDPALDEYQRWSPFASAANFKYQLRFVADQARQIRRVLSQFDELGLGLACAVLALLFRGRRWRLAVFWIAAMCATYLPVYGFESRYYLSNIPVLMVAALGVAGGLQQWLVGSAPALGGSASDRLTRLRGRLPFGVAAFVVLCFTVLPINLLWLNNRPTPQLLQAREAVPALEGVPDLRIASVGDGRVGLVAAWLLGMPWHGDQPSTRDADLAVASGANVLFVGRESPLVGKLAEDPRFSELTETAGARVYRVVVSPAMP